MYRLTPTRCTPGNVYLYDKKSTNQQLASNYQDPTVCHIPPLPQYSPYIFPHLCVCLSVSFTSVNHSSVQALSTLCDFDVPTLCEARSQLKV
nr:hypothetical transcript [Hymenolepis microstoma]